MARRRTVRDDDYTRLLTVRTRWRQFEQWSAEQAATHGLTPAQHQLLLAIRGHRGPQGPTISQAAAYLTIRINTAVELINRAQDLGLVTRVRDATDHRVVHLSLTPEGQHRLAALAEAHIAELTQLAPLLHSLLHDVDAPPSGKAAP